MGTEAVPNELLEVILYHALTTPTHVFESWRTHRTLCGSIPTGVSSILLVSKRWNALGTPALYESAILRTDAQIQTLAQTLTDRRNGRTLSRYLRKLRIEGGFGSAVITILKAAPGITTMFLGFDLTNFDSTAGLMRTLQKAKLEHLMLDSVPGGLLNTPMGVNLSKAVAGALPHWRKLKRVDVSPKFIFLPEMLSALTKAPALEWISMSNFTMNVNINGSNLAAIARNPSVKVIQIRALEKSTPLQLLRNIDEFVRVKMYVGVGKDMVKLTDFPEAEVVKENPGPLPDLPDKVWGRIIDYATHIDDRAMDENPLNLSRSLNPTRKAILLVDKKFNRLGLRQMYEVPHFTNDDNVNRFIKIVEEHHHLARLVRVLCLPDNATFQKRKPVLAPLVNLERVTNHFIVFPDIAPFVHIGESVSLQEASQWLAEGIVDSRLFKPFSNLRSLVLLDQYGAIVEDIPRDSFPKLEVLDLWGWNLVEKFIPADLPSLHTFGFEVQPHVVAQAVNFLQVHGHKLTTISVTGAYVTDPQPGYPPDPLLDLCPNLTELRIPCTRAPLNIPFIKHSKSHAKLARLVFPALIFNGYNGVFQVDPTWDPFIEQLTLYRDKLPALKQLSVLTSFEWPINRFEYDYFALTPLIDDLRLLGITFVDGSGAQWTKFMERKWRRQRMSQQAAPVGKETADTVPAGST